MTTMALNLNLRTFLAAFIILALFVMPAAARVVFVCDIGDGSDPASGRRGAAFPAIGPAIAALDPAGAGDTVVVYATVRDTAYRENLVLAPGLTLISAREYFPADTDGVPVIAGGAGAIVSGADSAILCGFQIDGQSRDKGNWGVNLSGVAHMTVSRVTARNCEYGFQLHSAWDSLLTDNFAESNTCGFVLTSSLANRLVGNRSTGNDWYGFVLAMSNGNTLADNRGERNGQQGFWLAMSARNRLTGNHSLANTGDGYYLHSSRDNEITGSVAEANTGSGFHLTGGSGGNFTGNTIIPGSGTDAGGVYCDQTGASLPFTDCYWSTADESAIAAMIRGPGAATIIWKPFRPER